MFTKPKEGSMTSKTLSPHNLETIEVVRSGHCPLCGSGIRRNLALIGWYQCEQYGDGHFRARPDEPKCSWQGFTE